MLSHIIFPPLLPDWLAGMAEHHSSLRSATSATKTQAKWNYILGYKEYLHIVLLSLSFYFACKTFAFPQSCTHAAKNVTSYMQNKTTGLSIKAEDIFMGVPRCFLWYSTPSTKKTQSNCLKFKLILVLFEEHQYSVVLVCFSNQVYAYMENHRLSLPSSIYHGGFVFVWGWESTDEPFNV